MDKFRIKSILFIVLITSLTLLLTILSGAALADENPQAFYKGKKITLVVTSSPGGGYDIWCRLLAPALEKATGAVVIVKNIPAAGGTVALHKSYHSKRPIGLEIILARAISTQLLEILDFPGTSARWSCAEFGWIGRLTWDVPAFAVNPKFKSIDDVKADNEFLVGVDRA